MSQLRYVLLVVTLVVLVGVSAVAVNVPNAFVAGEVISASEMNANFAALEEAVSALEGSAEALAAAQPVVAHARAAQPFVIVASDAVAEDVVVVSLEAPAAGVVIVSATAQAAFAGTTQPNRFAFAIDAVAGGDLTGDLEGEFVVGWAAPPNTGEVWIPVAIQRAFQVAGGVHEFRLEAQAVDLNGSKRLWSPSITATWFPDGSASLDATSASGAVAPTNAP